ncbi:MAG TPA: AIR synthase-related protein, partial [Myxococcaceae bacterium]|nr:AIR synthase-related protein [Myxococcaceae bacterium]
ETEGKAILPTPTVAVVGLLPDVSATCAGVFRKAGDKVAVLGETRGQLGGSEWLLMTAGKIAGRPPVLDAAREKALQTLVRELVRDRKVSSAHDTSEGGLAVALAECCMADGENPVGASVSLPVGSVPPHAYLFGEDASRVVISYAAEREAEIAAACKAAGVPFASIGTVGEDRLVISGLVDLPVARLSDAWRRGIPSLMKKPTHL